jgi:hypothetical protein
MNRRDFVWIGVRILGLYLSIEAVLAVPHLVLETFGVLNSVFHGGGGFGTLMGFGVSVIPVIIQAVLGIYFVFSGGMIVDILAKWPASKTVGQ